MLDKLFLCGIIELVEERDDHMKRSVYSIILSDDVVDAVDQRASAQGMSRSAYINQVLANHVRYTTPEQHMQQIFSHLIAEMEKRSTVFRIAEQGSDTMLSIFGSVPYKYRPTIRYQVELIRDEQSEYLGQLKVSCRTQSSSLIQLLQDFFTYWVELERQYNPQGVCAQGLYTISSGRLTRALPRQDVHGLPVSGEAVGDYIHMLHTILQSYCSGIQQEIPTEILQHTIAQQYQALLEKQTVYV